MSDTVIENIIMIFSDMMKSSDMMIKTTLD